MNGASGCSRYIPQLAVASGATAATAISNTAAFAHLQTAAVAVQVAAAPILALPAVQAVIIVGFVVGAVVIAKKMHEHTALKEKLLKDVRQNLAVFEHLAFSQAALMERIDKSLTSIDNKLREYEEIYRDASKGKVSDQDQERHLLLMLNKMVVFQNNGMVLMSKIGEMNLEALEELEEVLDHLNIDAMLPADFSTKMDEFNSNQKWVGLVNKYRAINSPGVNNQPNQKEISIKILSKQMATVTEELAFHVEAYKARYKSNQKKQVGHLEQVDINHGRIRQDIQDLSKYISKMEAEDFDLVSGLIDQINTSVTSLANSVSTNVLPKILQAGTQERKEWTREIAQIRQKYSIQ